MLIIIIIAISLSMDAFSLALAYGTLNLNRKDILINQQDNKIILTIKVTYRLDYSTENFSLVLLEETTN